MIDQENQTSDVNDRDAVSDLQHLCDKGFDGDMNAAALVLGRETEQLEGMIAGDEPVDEDLEMKIHGIAEERGIEFE